MKITLAFLLIITLPLPLEAASLRGSPRKAKLQNQWADRAGVKPVRSDQELSDLKNSGCLVPLPTGPGIIVDRRLDPELRFCRPEVAVFLNARGEAFYATFKRSFRVDSAVRTVSHQKTLNNKRGKKYNLNAAPAEGPEASSHLRGTTIDITKIGLTGKQIKWFRKDLGARAARGEVIVAEEFKQSVFHIMVKPVPCADEKTLPLFLMPLWVP